MASKKKPAAKAAAKRVLDARPDTIDFRDRMFVPTLVEVPQEIPLATYLSRYRAATDKPVPILDQGEEGACTGFGLAAVCNFLLGTRKVRPDRTIVSARMFYDMARRYDEWRGEDYDGSSNRGAMKGWHKHGVCSAQLWPLTKAGETLTAERATDAAQRPLGAYFRVNHKDLVSMHTALAEVGVLYVSSDVHTGWDDVGADGQIKPGGKVNGGHAFAIVGYDVDGFWMQNSWGPDWGKGGFAHIAYEDWLDHGYDAWVARLGAPVRVDKAMNVGSRIGGIATSRLSFPDIRPHVISIGNDGRLRQGGTYGNTAEDIAAIFKEGFPRITQGWKKPRILLYAHGGLVPEDNAIQRVENYLQVMLKHEVYPLAFIWKTDFWTTLKNMLQDALRQRRTEGAIDAAKDFMLDRLDDTLERIARTARGKLIWDEMKENALLATLRTAGGASVVAGHVASLLQVNPKAELHIAGHSAGSIFMAPLVQLLTSVGPIDPKPIEQQTPRTWDVRNGLGLKIKSCTMWAPACTVDLFKAGYLAAIKAGTVERYAQFSLTDVAEQDDHCAQVYNKSLLYLVSNALEREPRRFLGKHGTPILGMDKFVNLDPALKKLFGSGGADYITAPNNAAPGSDSASEATAHGAFDDDKPTLQATLNRILGKSTAKVQFAFGRSAASAGDRRRSLA